MQMTSDATHLIAALILACALWHWREAAAAAVTAALAAASTALFLVLLLAVMIGAGVACAISSIDAGKSEWED